MHSLNHYTMSTTNQLQISREPAVTFGDFVVCIRIQGKQKQFGPNKL